MHPTPYASPYVSPRSFLDGADAYDKVPLAKERPPPTQCMHPTPYVSPVHLQVPLAKERPLCPASL